VTDASPWGGGAFLVIDGSISEYFSDVWPPTLPVGAVAIQAGLPKYQPFWESVVVLQALELWALGRGAKPFAILSDCLAALAATSTGRGKGAVAAVVRELAWRTARQRWSISVGHIPSEFSTVADSLSRLSAPSPASLPTELVSARRRDPPAVLELWRAQPDAPHSDL